MSYILNALAIANNDPGKDFITILSVLHPCFLVHMSEDDLVIFAKMTLQFSPN